MTTPIWPPKFNLPADHCRDVLEGAYDVPYSPAVPPVIIDLGANVGAFTRWAVKRWPGCTVHAYEPHPGNFSMLQQTVAALDDPNKVTCHNIAVADRDCTAQLKQLGFNCGEWSIMVAPDSESKEPAPNVEVMEAGKLPTGDILKIDTEGAEIAILATLSAAGRLAEFSAIMIECHNGNWVRPLQVRMAEHSFELIEERIHAEHRREMKWMRKGVLLTESST